MKPQQLFATALTLLLPFQFFASSVSAMDIGPFKMTGYVRSYLSWNMEDIPETTADDDWDLQMNRAVLFLEGYGNIGPTRWTGRFRGTQELLTDYEERLEGTANFLRSLDGTGRTSDFADEYDEMDVRELFVDFSLGERLDFRLGRQQVVWGETDFFHATDVIHGYDFRWRSFYVPENEDVRKPLALINGTFQVPELNGSLQGIVRPGLDKSKWVGNSIPAFGGRWSNNLSKGTPLVSEVEGPWGFGAKYDYHHNEGDTDDPHYGARWTGLLGKNKDIDYSLMYYHGQGGFFQDPVLSLNPNTFGLEFVFPETDTVGGSLSGYIPFLDITYRAEVAYTWDRTFTSLNALPVFSSTLGATLPLPLQFVEEDAYNILIGFDANPRLQKWLKTSSQSLFTVQMFDWYIPGINERDALVHFLGEGVWDDHNILATSILTLPYMHDTLIVTLVGIADMTQGGGWFIPSIEKQWGPHWRVKLEADMSFGGNDITNPIVPDGSIVGAFENNNQLLLRTTYQF